jgi:hypothetical protein
MEATFERDLGHTEPIDPIVLDAKPLRRHLSVELARLTSPLL